MDVVRLHQAGIHYAVATLGTATTPEHLQAAVPPGAATWCSASTAIAPAARPPGARCRHALPRSARGPRARASCSCPRATTRTRWSARKGARPSRRASTGALPLSEYLVRSCAREVDLAHADGRARFAELRGRCSRRCPTGVYRELLLDRLAEVVRTAGRAAARAAGSPGATAPPTRPRRPGRCAAPQRAPPLERRPRQPGAPGDRAPAALPAIAAE